MLAVAGVGLGPSASAREQRMAFVQTNLVSDVPGMAALTDPALVNPWGLAHGPATPVWVSDNGADATTLYSTPAGGGVAKVSPGGNATIAIPGGVPTGQVFHDPADAGNFVVTENGKSGPAFFIFDSENGAITAWNPQVDTASAVTVAQGDNAVYKGLALWKTPLGSFLLAADFRNGRVDVFDSGFHRLPLPSTFFTDPTLPAGFAPFNVAVVGDAVYVSYAKQDAEKHDEVDGPGLGFVDVYTDFGQHRQRFASCGPLNAPWAITVAPASFGKFAGDILVGNFGDGRVNAFDNRGRFQGPLRGTDGKPLVIDGLWGLLPGTAANGGTDNLWFAAGINHEAHGLLGLIGPAKS
ncbi:TIGR03118 family protein [Catenulispora yoronensis]|uniref:TIGR03118 family protein n=2 Tax=Catenulispora yoronensis TaxID=450799 RepID=A0ABN2TWX7_9ACTN